MEKNRKDENSEDKNKSLKKIDEFQLALPSTEGDFREQLEAFASFLLFKTEWDKQDNVIKEINIIHDVPLICHVEFCPYAAKCDVLPNLSDAEKEELRETNCRSERIYGIKHFASLVKDLSIRPADSIDVQNVADLVRLFILKRRIDWQISIDGMIEREEYIADNKGTVLTRRDSHPLLKEYERINKQIISLSKQLMASRRDRLTIAKELNPSSKLISLFNKNIPPTPRQVEAETVDAEFKTEESETK